MSATGWKDAEGSPETKDEFSFQNGKDLGQSSGEGAVQAEGGGGKPELPQARAGYIEKTACLQLRRVSAQGLGCGIESWAGGRADDAIRWPGAGFYSDVCMPIGEIDSFFFFFLNKMNLWARGCKMINALLEA